MRKRILLFVGLATLAAACTTAGVENAQSAASALEEDSASDVTGDSDATGDEDSCSDVDGDSGSGGLPDDGASTVDGDSGSGGPTTSSSSSSGYSGSSSSGGNLNLAAVTPKPKPKPVCPPPKKHCKLYDEKDDDSACHWTGNYTGVAPGDPVTCYVTGKVYYYECKATKNGGTNWEPRSPKPNSDCKEFHVGPKPATVGGVGPQYPCR